MTPSNESETVTSGRSFVAPDSLVLVAALHCGPVWVRNSRSTTAETPRKTKGRPRQSGNGSDESEGKNCAQKTASVCQAVTHKVHAPALIRASNLCLHWLRVREPFAFPPRHLQPQLLRDPMHPAVPHGHSFQFQQCCQTPIPEARTLCC